VANLGKITRFPKLDLLLNDAWKKVPKDIIPNGGFSEKW